MHYSKQLRHTIRSLINGFIQETMKKRTPNKVDQYAKEIGFYGASYLIDWNGYEIYEPEFSQEDEIPMIGMPQFILYKPGEIRFSSFEEYKKFSKYLKE